MSHSNRNYFVSHNICGVTRNKRRKRNPVKRVFRYKSVITVIMLTGCLKLLAVSVSSQFMPSALLPYPSLLFPPNPCPQPSSRIPHYSSLTIHVLSPPPVSLITLPSQFMPSAPQHVLMCPFHTSEREVCPKTVFTVIVS